MNNLLGQINIGYLIAPIDDPAIADFVNNLDKINAIAEQSPGFIWRLKDDGNNATSFNPYNNPQIIVNISVWKDITALKTFVYNTEHVKFLQRRKEWFKPMDTPHMALWQTTKDLMPDASEGKQRLGHLWKHGPTAYAFDYKTYEQFLL